MKTYTAIGVLLSLLLIASCDQNERQKKEGRLVAEIGDFQLYDSDIHQQMVFKTGDSLLLANSITEDWLRKKSIYIESQNRTSVENRAEIASLVEDYKQSLYIHRYEKQLIDEFFNEEIALEEIQEYYKNHKEDFNLSEPIVRIHLAKMKENISGLDAFWTDWKKERLDAVGKFVKEHSTLSSMDNKTWKNLSDVMILLPPSKFKASSLEGKKTYQENYEDHEYFIRIFERLNAGEIAPIEFVTDRIKKVLRHQKEKAFLAKRKEKLYQDILDKKEIKLYQE